MCNPQYPVLKYTLDISGIATLFLNASQYTHLVRVNLSSLEIPALTRGHSYSVTIGACSEFTCRYSDSKLTVCKCVAIRSAIYLQLLCVL